MKTLPVLVVLAALSFAGPNAQGQDRFTHEDCEKFFKQITTSRTIYPLPAGAMVCETTSDISKYYGAWNDPTAKQRFSRGASRCKMEKPDVPYTLVKAEDDLIIRDFALLREWRLNNPTATTDGPFHIQPGMIEVRHIDRTAFAISIEWVPYPPRGDWNEVRTKWHACQMIQ